jgi:hypothetical protein
MKSSSRTDTPSSKIRSNKPTGKLSEGPQQRLARAFRNLQKLGAEIVDPSIELSRKDLENRLLEIVDDEETIKAVDQIDRPN